MAGDGWGKGVLIPELQPAQHRFGSKGSYDRRCNTLKPSAYCKAKPNWIAKPAAAIVGGNPEFL